jgi:hypothetical protein
MTQKSIENSRPFSFAFSAKSLYRTSAISGFAVVAKFGCCEI